MYTKVDVLVPKPREDFVETRFVRELTDRALNYIRIGFPIHFSGPTGVGKTTLAFHLASRLARPAVLIHGDYEFGTSNLVGGLYGYSRKYLRDNFIRSVLKIEESAAQQWMDDRLTVACEHGFTLIYDEFTRSRPEANNILLSVLEEGVLSLSPARAGGNYLKVHPTFSAIFTSNPMEYAGVQPSQDALRDRMVTIELGNFDEETEVGITQAKSHLSVKDSRRIVDLVRKVREAKSNKLTPTIRACVIIGKILNLKGGVALGSDHVFRQTCLDILMPEVAREEREKVRQVVEDSIKEWE